MKSGTIALISYAEGQKPFQHCAFGCSIPTRCEPHFQIEVGWLRDDNSFDGNYIRMTGADAVILMQQLQRIFKDDKKRK